ncbi:MAG: ABC transporter permease [Fluviicola sp.]
MKNSFLIAMREWRARVWSRSFLAMSVLGPLAVLIFTYLIFAFGDEGEQKWNVLIADPTNYMQGKIMPGEDKSVTYSFANSSIDHEVFREGARYQEYDAVIEINEKVLENKVSHVFFREAPSTRLRTKVQYQIERRMEEVFAQEKHGISVQKYRRIKKPLTMSFVDVYDPYGEGNSDNAWVGFFMGGVIILFIGLFGMTILRSVAREKSNRIVEVMMGSCSPRQLMSGKILGVGLSAMLQFIIWMVIIALGLYWMRETLFVDLFDPRSGNFDQAAQQLQSQSYAAKQFSSIEYNRFVDLVYNKINFSLMLSYFIGFFIGGYLFYAAFFAALGASMGTESDGQQFVLPLVFILLISLYTGYYTMNYPGSTLVSWLQYLPFTSPVVAMVKLAQGYGENGYQIYISMTVLYASAIGMLLIASRIYKNGILQFGHRLRLVHLLKWLRKT